MTLIDRARESDREMNAARTPAEMRDAVHRRRLIRAELEFTHAMDQLERSAPVPAVLRDSFPITLGR